MNQDCIIRLFEWKDEDLVIDLWRTCGLIVPQNNPHRDIRLKMDFQPDLFFVGEIKGRLIATAMAGYEGHRGWINYLSVHPDYQHQGLGRGLMDKAERVLKSLGCIKINLQVRHTNKQVIDFYKSLGYKIDEVVSLGKRLSE